MKKRSRIPLMETDYSGVTIAVSKDEPHLGGNVLEGDPYTFCPRVWSYVIERFAISSVLDLGSGIGLSADFFFRKGLRTIAVDGLSDNVKMALYPTVCHDLTKSPVLTSVDLVHCQEVVEHIDERFLENLLLTLSCGRMVLMTHALPGQGGHHHVNEKRDRYWVEHLARLGYGLLLEDTKRIRTIAKNEHAAYMHATGLIFHKRRSGLPKSTV
jgi:2-polyprenyl-3-methyl-5-hydroxy-6-metoxy-1,4-benzoquinol methylase